MEEWVLLHLNTLKKEANWPLGNGQCQNIHRENCTAFDIVWKTSQIF